jgi:hypothetical protein
MDFQNTKWTIKVVYGHSDSESSDNEHRKQLHIMYDGSWDITFRRVVKTPRRMVAAAAPAPIVAPHHKWMETSITFDASDCPKNMTGVGQLPQVVSPTIANVRLYHVLIDGGQPSTSSVSRLSRSCRFPCPGSPLCTHFWVWARAPSSRGVATPSRSHSGCLRTTTQRASSSMLWRSTCPSMPSLVGQPSTSSWSSPNMGTWS